jgi:hypothetical protein
MTVLVDWWVGNEPVLRRITMMMRKFNWDVHLSVVGHRVSEWEKSRDTDDSEKLVRESLEQAGFDVTQVMIRAVRTLCSKCEGHMNHGDNFCSKCGEKA